MKAFEVSYVIEKPDAPPPPVVLLLIWNIIVINKTLPRAPCQVSSKLLLLNSFLCPDTVRNISSWLNRYDWYTVCIKAFIRLFNIKSSTFTTCEKTLSCHQTWSVRWGVQWPRPLLPPPPTSTAGALCLDRAHLFYLGLHFDLNRTPTVCDANQIEKWSTANSRCLQEPHVATTTHK